MGEWQRRGEGIDSIITWLTGCRQCGQAPGAGVFHSGTRSPYTTRATYTSHHTYSYTTGANHTSTTGANCQGNSGTQNIWDQYTATCGGQQQQQCRGQILEQCHRWKQKTRRFSRPKITILSGGIPNISYRQRGKSFGTKTGGRKQRITIWARAKSKTAECWELARGWWPQCSTAAVRWRTISTQYTDVRWWDWRFRRE